MEKVIVITGTPGVGKTAIAKRLKHDLKPVAFLDINKIIAANNLYKGKDEYGAKIVKIDKLAKIINREIKSRYKNKKVVIESHLLCDIKVKNAKAIVLREHLKKLKQRLLKRKYEIGKIRDNLVSEATNYCGIRSIRNYEIVYEFMSSEKDTYQKIKKLIESNQKPIKRHIELAKELADIIRQDKRFVI